MSVNIFKYFLFWNRWWYKVYLNWLNLWSDTLKFFMILYGKCLYNEFHSLTVEPKWKIEKFITNEKMALCICWEYVFRLCTGPSVLWYLLLCFKVLLLEVGKSNVNYNHEHVLTWGMLLLALGAWVLWFQYALSISKCRMHLHKPLWATCQSLQVLNSLMLTVP